MSRRRTRSRQFNPPTAPVDPRAIFWSGDWLANDRGADYERAQQIEEGRRRAKTESVAVELHHPHKLTSTGGNNG